jgi:site-specific DNA-methyltransferase (adenine-specific)
MKYEVLHGDCLDLLPKLGRAACIFADPPDNIGLGYGEYKDGLPDDEYAALLADWVTCFVEHASTVWISFNVKWHIEMAIIASALQARHPTLSLKPCVQTFTFGQHNKNDFGNNHRPLWRFKWSTGPIYPEQIKVESWRQKHGDKRAAPGGRVPGDVFDFPRVTGNSKQRRKWHPTQLHEGLVERCIKSCTQKGDLVIDPFAGTGTTMRVCKRIGRPCITTDVDLTYCTNIAAENDLRVELS